MTNTVFASTDAPPLAYQWRFNDQALDLETGRNLILTKCPIATRRELF